MKKILPLLFVYLSLSNPCFAAKVLGNKHLDIPLVSKVNEDGYKIEIENKLSFIYYFKDGKTEKYDKVDILPSGTINIPRVGETKVISFVVKDIERLIEDSVQDISEAVVFIHRAPNNISILGEVNSPGSYSLENIKTVYDAIGKAKGFTDIAKEREVKLIRQRIDGTRITYLINFPKDIYNAYEENSGVGEEVYLLKEGDIIYVNSSKWKRLKKSASQIFGIVTVGAVTGASAGFVNSAID